MVGRPYNEQYWVALSGKTQREFILHMRDSINKWERIEIAIKSEHYKDNSLIGITEKCGMCNAFNSACGLCPLYTDNKRCYERGIYQKIFDRLEDQPVYKIENIVKSIKDDILTYATDLTGYLRGLIDYIERHNND